MPVLDTFTPDNLFAGNVSPVVTETGTVIGTLSRGTIMGKILKGAATGAADEGNTGDATITLVTKGQAAELGVYVITCTTTPSEASADDASFSVVTPNGEKLKDAVQGVAYASNHVNFTIGDATAVDLVAGDLFTVTVAAGSEKYAIVSSAAVDGSNVPCAVLAEDIVGGAGGVIGVLYMSGEFNEGALIITEGDTVASYKTALRAVGIFLKTVA